MISSFQLFNNKFGIFSGINLFCICGKIIQTGFDKRSEFFFCLTIIEENMVKFISRFYIACLIVVQYCWNELCMMIFLLFIAFYQFLSIFIFCIFCHISFLFFILPRFFNICFCHMVILIGLFDLRLFIL